MNSIFTGLSWSELDSSLEESPVTLKPSEVLEDEDTIRMSQSDMQVLLSETKPPIE